MSSRGVTCIELELHYAFYHSSIYISMVIRAVLRRNKTFVSVNQTAETVGDQYKFYKPATATGEGTHTQLELWCVMTGCH